MNSDCDLSSPELCTSPDPPANPQTSPVDHPDHSSSHTQETQVEDVLRGVPVIYAPLSASRKPSLSINTTRENHALSGANADDPQLSPSLRSAYRITRVPSFRTPLTPASSAFAIPQQQQQQQSEYDPFNYLLCSSSAYLRPGGGCTANTSTTSLRSISCTPTTENLARRMGGHSSGPCHAPSRSGSSFDSEFCSQRFPLTGDGSLDGFQQGDPGKSNTAGPQSPTKSAGNTSTHSLNSFGEEGTLTKIDLVSYLPKIPVACTTASEEERLAKWGPGIGPPKGGSVYKNPHNYEILEAYFEKADHPMYNVTESTRRAGNAAIQTMFDPLYALPGVDGRIPRGFPLYGFSMREMPSESLRDSNSVVFHGEEPWLTYMVQAANLHAVLHAYGIVPVEGVGYDIDRQNMSLLCGHIGATWLSGVI
ncbi:hypothetical protein Dda_3525 [Drechslerella dactyloides]|uniref:Uncharacterized protein n=1 Tax=Drechslerella dactyloides TaxID=74499 RepID=A0AAD6IY45_DREDA|nr:hypothetical protein Dda_3525 [Drechslerella dactyloides]